MDNQPTALTQIFEDARRFNGTIYGKPGALFIHIGRERVAVSDDEAQEIRFYQIEMVELARADQRQRGLFVDDECQAFEPSARHLSAAAALRAFDQLEVAA